MAFDPFAHPERPSAALVAMLMRRTSETDRMIASLRTDVKKAIAMLATGEPNLLLNRAGYYKVRRTIEERKSKIEELTRERAGMSDKLKRQRHLELERSKRLAQQAPLLPHLQRRLQPLIYAQAQQRVQKAPQAQTPLQSGGQETDDEETEDELPQPATPTLTMPQQMTPRRRTKQRQTPQRQSPRQAQKQRKRGSEASTSSESPPSPLPTTPAVYFAPRQTCYPRPPKYINPEGTYTYLPPPGPNSVHALPYFPPPIPRPSPRPLPRSVLMAPPRPFSYYQ